MKKAKVWWALALAGAVGGCYTIGGGDFVRPPQDQLQLGRSSDRNVLAAINGTGTITRVQRNGATIECHKFLNYGGEGWAIGRGSLAGGSVGHELSVCFTSGVLVGYVYSSNRSADATNFDVDKARTIEKGRMTGGQVIALLGKPSGSAIYPLADNRGGGELRYSFTGFEGTVVGNRVSKDVTVVVDANDIVTDVQIKTGKPE